MNRRGALVRLLADGELHSGEALAHTLGVTRAAVAKQIPALADWGIDVETLPRRGYRLAMPVELLDLAGLRAALAPASRVRLDRLEIHDELPSTNTHLLADTDLAPGRYRVCLAEFQTAGRGRRGRVWRQPFASGLCLSFGWLFREPPAALGALSLAAGVATLRALRRCGVEALTLKWPNDVLKEGAKLGGILSELRLESAGPAYVVIGIGLNVRLPAALKDDIVAAGGVPAADLATGPGTPPSRAFLAATLIDELLAVVVEFDRCGFGPFAAEWRDADALRDRRVQVHARDAVRDGVARGIDSVGGLRVEIDGRLETLTAGEVTLRAVT